MNTAPLADPNAPRGRPRRRHVRHSCGACGHVFTLHYTAVVSAAPVTASVPCTSDGCGAEIEVLLPPRAFAVWTEEFS